MSQIIFIKKNLDILLLAIDSLDPYITNYFYLNLTNYNKIINLLEIFTYRTKNCIPNKQSGNFSNFYKVAVIIYEILKVCSSSEIQKNIFNLLTGNNKNNNLYFLQEQYQFLKKFTINYRKLFRPYLIGYNNYINDDYIHRLGLINLYTLYKFNESTSIYVIFSYLISNR